ncbi:MAG: PSK operon transcription factor [Alphaproteobacteria bacterium]|nr:PSK operon transcription factor [Alphaproteobacteria bacterium]
MALNVKNREVEALVAELKAATGKGTTELLLDLLRREAAARRRPDDIEERLKRVAAITRRAAARLPKRRRTIEDIIGYDERGLPK